MKVILADDEPLARRRLQALLAECPGVELLASAADAESALAACAEHEPDILLTDVRMPGLDGLDAARRLRAINEHIHIIFCTAFEEHALDAWEVRASDYLLKPVSLERLRHALARVREQVRAAPRRPWLHARRAGETLRIDLAEVLYLSAGDKYVSAHLTGDTVLLDDSLAALQQAHPEHLVRIHRNCLVPRRRVLGLRTTPDGGAEVRIEGSDVRLEVSRRQVAAVRKLLRE